MSEKSIRHKLILNQIFYTHPHLKSAENTLNSLCHDLNDLNSFLSDTLKETFHKTSHYFTESYIKKIETTCHSLALKIISIDEAEYPKTLLSLPDPPFAIFAKGNTQLLQEEQIALVGSRQASAYGIQTTRFFSSHIAKSFVITSGLAKGIDAEAHQAALLQQKKTIAVCACGLDACYPYTNQNLFNKIAEEGCLITEFPLFSKPLKFHFLQRNRIIAALSKGVLVTEAGSKSGALNTVQHALELGQDIFVTPSSIFSPQSKGSLKLLKEGAICVTEPKDILSYYLEHFPVQGNLFEEDHLSNLDENAKKILGALNQFPLHLDDLAKHTQLPLTTILSNLTELELEQKVDVKGGYVSRI